jgi:hypothetical protein
MIANSYSIRYGASVPTDTKWTSSETDTSYNYSYSYNYQTIVHIPEPLPLKEMMKLWAKERMKKFWSDFLPREKKPIFIIPDRPVSLRGVRLNGHGWAI